MTRKIDVRFVLFVTLLLIPSSDVRSEVPAGYFMDVQRVPGIDEGVWRDQMGSISADGKTIYFDSDFGADPQPPFGSELPFMELYVAKRASTDDAFGSRELLDVSIDGIFDNSPVISLDGLTLTFDSDRTREGDTNPSWVSTRETIDAPWSDPVPSIDVYPVENLAERDFHRPVFSPDGLRVIFESRADTDFDLYSAGRSSVDEPFGDVTLLDINRSGQQDHGASLSFDERTLFFIRTPGLEFTHNEILVAHRDSADASFEDEVRIDEFSLGRRSPDRHPDARVVNNATAAWNPVISPDWPADGSKIYWSSTCCGNNWDIFEATWRQATSTPGDLTGDGALGADDIQILTNAVRLSVNAAGFDLNSDGMVDAVDRHHWVTTLAGTYFGDSNLDGEFNSGDFVAVFRAGEYEDDLAMNSTWDTGDWNGDGEFDSGDFVLAFQERGYEKGPRNAVRAVPEPSSFMLLAFAMMAVAIRRRQAS